jgi:hypothetical protein
LMFKHHEPERPTAITEPQKRVITQAEVKQPAKN